MRERVDEHERLLKEDSRNSSRAPSNDPPLTRQQRRPRERERAKQQGRKKRGGQPGHEGKSRELAAPERVDDHVEDVPCCASLSFGTVKSLQFGIRQAGTK